MLALSPAVSVIVPVYNARPYLNATVASILGQTMDNLEVLLIDDHSDDGSYELAQDLAKGHGRIRSLRFERPFRGPAGPRNHGVTQARSNLIAFCDADDMWMPEKIERQMEVLRESGAGMCSTQAKRFRDQQGIELQDYSLESPAQWRKVGFLENQIKNKIVTSSVLIERELLMKYPFNTAPEYRVVEDYDVWLRVIEETGFCAKITAPLVAYRICESQISANKFAQIKRVFGVHWRYGGALAKPKAVIFAGTHGLVAAYQRALGRSV